MIPMHDSQKAPSDREMRYRAKKLFNLLVREIERQKKDDVDRSDQSDQSGRTRENEKDEAVPA